MEEGERKTEGRRQKAEKETGNGLGVEDGRQKAKGRKQKEMKIEKYWISGVMAAILIFYFLAIFITPSFGDELNYHYPLAKNITFKKIISPGSDYSSAYMPLPYLIGNGVLRIFNSLQALRVMNFIVFMLAIFFFDRVARSFSVNTGS